MRFTLDGDERKDLGVAWLRRGPALLLAGATVFFAMAACGSTSSPASMPTPGTLSVNPSAWPNPALTPGGALIASGLKIDGRELMLAFSRLDSPAGQIVQQAAWLEPATGALTLAASPAWGWHSPGTSASGLRDFTQLTTSAGLLEYGFIVGPAARVTIEGAGRRVEAGVASWSLDHSVVAFWSVRQGPPTFHGSPDGDRPTVVALDTAGTEIDHVRLTEPPQRQDG